MNKYLEKIAKDEYLSKEQKAGAGGLAAAVGAKTIHDQYHGGHLTGRESLYHGTSVANKETILKEGLKPRAKKGIIDLVQEFGGNSLKSDNLSFMTRSKMQAHQYANQATRIEKGTFKMDNMAARARDTLPSRKSAKGIVHINAPTWKKEEYKKVLNPEVKIQFRNIKQDIFTPKSMKKQMKGAVYNELEAKVFTNKGAVGTKHMKGSPNYQKNSLGEIREFVKANPKRFLKGVGKTVGGAVALGAGLAYAAKQFKKHGK